MDGEFGKKYINFLRYAIPGSKLTSGGREINCRCMYCPDSKDPTHGHMYIHIPTDDNDMSEFYCQKCHTGGFVTSRILIEWGVYDPEIAIGIDKINHQATKQYTTKGKQFIRQVYGISNHITDYNLAAVKANYINKRLGLNLSIKELMDDRIIFNLKDLLLYNKFSFTRSVQIIDQLNDNFVGFLSMDNNFINLRRICGEGVVYHGIDTRYVNYNIHDKRDNTEKYYVIIPNAIDLSNPARVQVHIAEGPFDILSIKYNIPHRDPDRIIYAAIGGSGYQGLVMHLINYMKLYYIELHIYPDNDDSGNESKIENIKNYIKPYMIPMYIHRNTYEGEKDYGVDKNHIIDTIYDA